MKKAPWAVVGFGLLLGTSAAFAAESSSTSSSTSTTITQDKAAFSAADTNHDGYISKTEAQQAGMSDYSVADKNGDGRLDANEFATANVDTSRSSHSSSSSSMSKPKQPSDSSSMTSNATRRVRPEAQARLAPRCQTRNSIVYRRS